MGSQLAVVGVPIIDIHAHVARFGGYRTVGLAGFWSRLTAVELVRHMRRRGVRVAVLMPVASIDNLEDEGFYIPTSCVLEVCELFPELFVPFCWFEPWRSDLLEEIERHVREMGCRGVGEVKCRVRVDHPVLRRVYDLCARLEVPVLLHIDNRYNYDIRAFERVAKEHSSTTFIAHGPGWWREISADADPSYWESREVPPADISYPKGRVEPGGYVERILGECDNVYADLSAYSGYNALARDLENARRFVREHHRRLLYGSDAIDYFAPRCDLLRLLADLGVEEGVLADVLWRNAAEILGLRGLI